MYSSAVGRMYIYEKHKTPCSDRIACFLSKHQCSIFSTCLSDSDGEGQTTCRGAPADLIIVTVLKSVLTEGYTKFKDKFIDNIM